MTRMISRLFLLICIFGLSTAPILGLSPVVVHAATVSAPAPDRAHSSPLDVLAYALGAGALGITIRKDTGTMAKKFVRNAAAAAGDYKDGVQGAGGEWESRTREAAASYVAGVQEAIGDGRFEKGVAGSASKYQENAVKLGSQRYGPGVQNAEGAWQRGVQPAIDALKSLNLPPRGPRRSPANMQRAEAVARTLGATKVGK